MVPLAYLRPNSLNALTLGAICVRQSAYRTNDELFRYTLGERDTDPDRRRSSDCLRRINCGLCAGRRSESCGPCSRWGGSLRALQATLPRHSPSWTCGCQNSQLWLSGFTATSYFDFASSSPQPAFRVEPIGRALSGPSRHALKNKPVSRRVTRSKARFVQEKRSKKPNDPFSKK